jgi:hypothetical protein
LSAQLLDLFEVMAAVDPMKLSPLSRSQGSEHGMIEHACALAKASFTSRDYFVHGEDLWRESVGDFAHRHTARPGALRSLPSSW